MLAVAPAMSVLFAPTGHKNKVVKISPLVTEGSIEIEHALPIRVEPSSAYLPQVRAKGLIFSNYPS
jgi:hypothetical protein